MENNVQKMREIIKGFADAFCGDGIVYGSEVDDLLQQARSALALPLRQCDIWTDEEQVDRYCRHCQTHCISCEHRHACNVCGERYRLRCFARWAQTPYEAKEGAGE